MKKRDAEGERDERVTVTEGIAREKRSLNERSLNVKRMRE